MGISYGCTLTWLNQGLWESMHNCTLHAANNMLPKLYKWSCWCLYCRYWNQCLQYITGRWIASYNELVQDRPQSSIPCFAFLTAILNNRRVGHCMQTQKDALVIALWSLDFILLCTSLIEVLVKVISADKLAKSGQTICVLEQFLTRKVKTYPKCVGLCLATVFASFSQLCVLLL